jgi:hypothetical protein
VNQPAALVEKAATVFIDHDTVGINQHYWCRIFATRINRLSVHAVPPKLAAVG